MNNQYFVIDNSILEDENTTAAYKYIYMVLMTFKDKDEKQVVLNIETIAERAELSYDKTKQMLAKLNIERERIRFDKGSKKGYQGPYKYDIKNAKTGTIVPHDIIFNKNLSSLTKVFYIRMKRTLKNKQFFSRITIAKISEILKMDKKAVTRHLQSLINEGILEYGKQYSKDGDYTIDKKLIIFVHEQKFIKSLQKSKITENIDNITKQVEIKEMVIENDRYGEINRHPHKQYYHNIN